MSDTELSLADLLAVAKPLCGGSWLQYHFAKTHKDRLAALEGILEHCYNLLIDNRQLKKNLPEDELTVQIVDQLKMLHIQATNDERRGGHCDILVRASDHFLWIAEAKIHHDFLWLQKGFVQLSVRYGVSLRGRDNGELLIYCRNKDAAAVLRAWRDMVLGSYEGVSILEDEIDTQLYFRTRYPCETSGLPFNIRHRIVPMYWPGSTAKGVS